MWRAETRRIYDRKSLRYPTDMTDPEWEHGIPSVDSLRHSLTFRNLRPKVV